MYLKELMLVGAMAEFMSFITSGKSSFAGDNAPLFQTNTLLNSPNHLWHLQALVGDDLVNQAVEGNNGQPNDYLVIRLLIESPLPFFTDATQRTLLMGTSELKERDFGPLTPLNPVIALVKFGLAKMEEANERGYARL